MFSLFELVWKRIRLFFTDDEVFYIGGADVLPPPLEREQENRCLIALSGLHGDSEPMTREDARKQLIEHNLRLVVYLARKFENTGICVVRPMWSVHLQDVMRRPEKRRKKEKTNGSIFDAKCDRTDTDGLPRCGNC